MGTLRFTRLLGSIALWALTVGSVAALLVVGIGPHLGNYRTLTVLTGSMRPTIEPGSIVVVVPVRPEAVQVGDVLTFQAPVGSNPVVTHRVIELVASGPNPVIRTKGDANETPDPWQARIEGSTAWRVSHVVPKVGFAIGWFRNPVAHRLTVLAAPALLVAAALVEIWGGTSKRRPDVPVAPSGSPA